MSFQHLLYLKLDRSEENVFCYSQIFIIFEALIPYLEHKGRLIFNPLTTNVPCHIESSQLICNANQLTGFYMMGNIARLWVENVWILSFLLSTHYSDSETLCLDYLRKSQSECPNRLRA